MESLRLILDLEATGFQDEPYIVSKHTGEVVIGGMSNGTINGKPTVMIGLDMDDHILVVETTLALLLTAADAFKAKYGDPRL